MKRILLSAAVLSVSVGLRAQVGIEEKDPKAMLDVAGDLRVQSVPEVNTVKEDYSKCPCLLLIGEDGKLKRYGNAEALEALGIKPGTTTGGDTSGNPGGGQGGNPSQGGSQGGDNQSTGGANLGTGVRANISDQEDFVVSFIYDGHQLQGKIDNSSNKVVVKIPYTGGNGAQYNEATSTTMTNVASAQDGTSSPITMTIKQGALSSGNGNITAEITTPALYNVKKLAPGKVETIAEFKYTVNGITRKVVLKAVGGVPDKNFADADHKFIYVPVTVEGTHNVNGKRYSKVWLNQNLGADYAKVGGKHFNPKKVGGDNKSDYKAYGSLFQFGRPADGHELVTWANSTSGSPAKTGYTWKSNSDLSYSKDNDPCPKGYHTPSESEWQDLHQALTGSRTSGSYSAIWNDNTKLGLTAAGYRYFSSGSSFDNQSNYGYYWSSTTNGSDYGRYLYFYNSSSNPQYYSYRSNGFSVRCLKDGQ